jgi:hypothetical protein
MDALRLAAIAAVCAFAAASLGISAAQGWVRTLTISNHVAQKPWSIWLFGVVDVACCALLGVYTWAWLAPVAGISWPTGALLTLVFALLAGAGFFPRTMDWKGDVHQWFAWKAAAVVIFAAVALTVDTWRQAPGWVRAVNAVFLAYCLVVAVIRRTPLLKRWFLYWEIGLFFGFMLVLLLAA